MKVSKKILTLFTVTLIIGLLTVGTVSKATNSFIKLQPPTEGVWTISGLETITDDVIINGSILIEEGGELRIINSTVDFLANQTFSCTIELKDGATLYVENSILQPTDSMYNFTIKATHLSSNLSVVSSVTFIESFVLYALIDVRNAADFTIDTTDFNGCSFYIKSSQNILIENSEFIAAEIGLELVDSGSIEISYCVFDGVNYGLLIDNADDLVLDNNEFDTTVEVGLQIDDIVPVEITNNYFHHAKVAAYLEDSRITLTDNFFWNLETGIVLDNADLSTINNNNFTDVSDVCIEAEGTRASLITENRFIDSNQAIDFFISPNWIINNYFDNLENGVAVLDSDGIEVSNNEFYNISEKAVDIVDSRDAVISFNVFYNATVGINLLGGRNNEIESNVLTFVGEGIGVISSREVIILGNVINNTITGIYVEQTKEVVITANGAINAEYGITLWSTSFGILASNGIFDSVYGVSIWFSDNIRLFGNNVNTSDIGIVARNTLYLQIRDGTYKALNTGIQIIGCTSPIVTGNSFDSIVGEAITFIDSNGFSVYHNNFGTVGQYGSIIDCLGLFYKQLDNVTFEGNYYVNEPGATEILIDLVTIDFVDYEIKDLYPLDNIYTVIPSIEYVTRDILNPQDINEVFIESQIFVPTDTEDVKVYLQYLLNNAPTWINIDITSSGTPIGSIGAINSYSGTLPAFDYDNLIIYRIMVEYTDELVSKQVFSVNASYVVLESDFTPVYISTPEISILTTDEDGQDVTLPTTLFYENEKYMVTVEITNRTDLETRTGKNHVNITWSEFDPSNNVTTGFTAIMDYNGTAYVPYYYFEFGKGFDVNTSIEFFISVVDINGTFYRTVNNYTIYIESPVAKTGFDALTLLSIGATLLIIQAMVVYRRRRKQEE
ncbi:MAG: right-handed parallel beta-helix repeat-containing protein [Candidatus Heimdallarchaeaceae archaeon]